MKKHPGLLAARYLKTMHATKGNHQLGAIYAASQSWIESQQLAHDCKAMVGALSTADIAATATSADFSAAVRARTVMNRIPGVRRVPALVRILNGVGKSQASFVAQGAAIKVSALELAGEIMNELKVAGISVLSNELLESSSPAADSILTDDIVAACAEAADLAFLDPANAGAADERPASVTNGAHSAASTGSTFAQVDADLTGMMQHLVAVGSDMQNAAWVIRPETAIFLSTLRDPNGGAAYPAISVLGGSLKGLPVIVSANMAEPGSPPSGYIVLIDGSQLAVVDEGAAQLEIARNGALQMLDNPTNNSVTGTAANMVSLFQTNCSAFRGVLWTNWQMRRPYISVLSGVTY
jgi:HK97 family phage major capsid protein